jgi:glutamate racemase
VFDSGVGGLTVVRALLRRFPAERVLYVADQAHVPYGERPLEEVCGFASSISAFLAGQGCRAIIMACNISSATALPLVSAAFAPHPVLGVITPAARRAAQLCASRFEEGISNQVSPIGVLATPGTVRSGAYAAQIRQFYPAACVTEVPCPKFVPLVEAEAVETPEAHQAAQEYLAPLAEAGCRIILLGCTHYPFLLPTLRRASAELFPAPVTFIDPADEMADALCAVLPDVGKAKPAGSHVLLTTGDPAVFRAQAPHFLPNIAFEIVTARWQDEFLTTPALTSLRYTLYGRL